MIILSFVVQNYPAQHHVIKTRRYKDVLRFFNATLLIFMLKLNLLNNTYNIATAQPLHLSHLYYNYFTSRF
jgi:hypothetical protein